MRFNTFLILIFFTINALSAGTYFKPPALIEGFTTVTSAAGTTTLTRASETKLIITGATTQTVVLPDATTMSTELGRRFYIINKSSGNVTVNASGGGLLTTLSTGTQAEIHLRAAGSAAGTWDVLSSSGGGGGTWGSITGTLSAQTDLNTALSGKALTDLSNISATAAGSHIRPGASGVYDLGSSTFKWNTAYLGIGANKAVTIGTSGDLQASATTDTQLGYLSTTTSDVQTQLDAKQARSTLTTKGDLYVATASATTARQGVGSNGQVLMSDSTQTNGVKWTTPTSENLIFDGNAESGITNFVEGSYSAATRPSGTFTASSGAGTFQISTTSTNPIFGTNSFLLTKSSGASRQGRAIERTINLDSGYQTKRLKTRIDYTIVSGTFVAGSNGSSPTDSSLIWYVGQYNGSTWSYTEPSTFKMFSNSTTNKDWVEGEFQVNSDTTQLKLIGFISESANSAWVVKAEVGFRLSTFLAGTTITDWKTYTPTVSNLGTGSTTTNTAKYRQVGDSAEFMIYFQKDGSGGSGASVVTWSLPPGLSIDATKLPSGSNTAKADNIGHAWVVAGGNYSANDYEVLANTATTLAVSKPTTSTQLTGADLGASTYIIMRATVPIQGWASSTQQSDGYDGRQIVLSRFNQTTQSINNSVSSIVDFPVASIDTTASWRASSGAFNSAAGTFATTNPGYVVPSGGEYRVSAGVRFQGTASPAANSNLLLNIYLDGAIAVEALGSWQNGGSAGSNIGPGASGSATIRARAGQVIDIRIVHSFGTAAVLDNNSRTYLSIEKLQSPTTMSATERVSAILSLPSGQALGSATVDTVIYTSKEEDTHGAFNTSTGEYTCPYSGRYDIVVLMTCSARSSAAFDLTGYVYVNGVEKASLNNYSGVNTVLHNFPINLNTSVLCNAGDKITIRGRAGYSGESLVANSAKNRVSIIKAK